SDESGNEIDAAIVRHGGGKGFYIFRASNESKAVAQPLHNGTANEDAAFKRVLSNVVQPPGNRGDQAVGGRYGASASILQHEATGAVRVLGESGMNAALAEQRRLLIAGDTCERNFL